MVLKQQEDKKRCHKIRENVDAYMRQKKTIKTTTTTKKHVVPWWKEIQKQYAY